ncbi:SPOR domain-containing protein [Comamonas sp. NLF-1-9]|uniref:SPOR domain-containing protein n=1 Tax=Comamonas sp. NLF-1-9 TaxID=2853163 RepID=UPI001C4719BE|nr:SPOR domain-containing protein [Comamonas sp. NLF-1-9]QXL83887.1 SPOR domain-containing protein [Comamonas sp. NLF-1-9]
MLRLAVLVLLLANLGYYAWSSGQLQPWGLAPHGEAEPERLQRQIAPQNLELLPPARPRPAPPAAHAPADTPPAAAALAQAAAEPAACLQAGPLNEERAKGLRSALASLPAGSWTLEPSEVPARWMVYMGRFADEEALARKRAELRALKLAFDRPGPALEPGLSLGRFASEEAAQQGLADLVARGVRTARVVQERAAQPRYTLVLPAATAGLRAQLDALALRWDDTPLQACS